MKHFHTKVRILSLLFLAVFAGFCAGVLAQRAGIPRRVKQLAFKTESESIYIPISVVEEVEPKGPTTVWLRKFPYPFKAALAIASDIDSCRAEEFDEIHQFLNTTEMTTMGPGLGLDIADSMWMYDIGDVDPHQEPSMSYWKGIKPETIKDAEHIRQAIEQGWIDSLHTYGNFSRVKNSFRRELAKAALEELSSKGIFLDVWIDHGDQCNRQNFAQYYIYSYQHGDDPNSPVYHTDLLTAYGVRYAWGPHRREFGTEKLAVPLTLRDGQRIWQFSRCVSDGPGRSGYNWFPNTIHRQLSEDNLKKLVENSHWEILANHFGRATPGKAGRVKTRPPFGPEARKALRRLAYEFRRGNIMVLRTSRLLKYYVVSKYLHWEYDPDNNTIYINSVDEPVFGRYVPTLEDVRGITFYISSPICPDIILGSKRLQEPDLVQNAHDGTAYSVSIRPYFRYR